MNQESKTIKILYVLFLLSVTARTLVALYDRFKTEDKIADH
jgi:hypothetical protein